jgi:hypothetical protein
VSPLMTALTAVEVLVAVDVPLLDVEVEVELDETASVTAAAVFETIVREIPSRTPLMQTTFAFVPMWKPSAFGEIETTRQVVF